MSTHIDPGTKKILISEDDGSRLAPDSGQSSSTVAAQTGQRLAPVWRDWRVGAVAAASGTAVWALIAAWWMPRAR